jgi:hypothetical protein
MSIPKDFSEQYENFHGFLLPAGTCCSNGAIRLDLVKWNFFQVTTLLFTNAVFQFCDVDFTEIVHNNPSILLYTYQEIWDFYPKEIQFRAKT